jgi:hypothetical protein
MALEPALVGTVASVANSSGLTKTFGERIGKAIDYASNRYKLGRFSDFKANYVGFCYSHLLIKTISSPLVSVHIDEIYVSLVLRGPGTVEVGDGTTLDTVNRVAVITGLAGQGKSTLLKKLLSNNIDRIDRLPFLYELKNYRGGSIESALSLNLKGHGIELSSSGFEQLLMDSNVRLYLDAFDECPTQFRRELFGEINKLVAKYKCSVTCTTRPDTELNALSSADNYTVDYLTNEKVKEILSRACQGTGKAELLYAALEKSKFHNGSESVLRSPILVVLFCVSYNLGMCIPESLSQFYKHIFETVFHQHDNLKGFVERERHWNDNRQIYKNIFDYFCFISQKIGVNSFDRAQYTKLIGDSLKYLNQDVAVADKIADEIAGITNLIIMDGYNEYKFIHKSIQEFFSATFLAGLDTEKKEAFYKKCAESFEFYSVFSNTLIFLEEIDHHSYVKFFLIPAVSHFLSTDGKKIENTFELPGVISNLFLKSVRYSVLYKAGYDKKAKAPTIETLLGPPMVALDCNATLSHLVFSKALGFMPPGAPSKKQFEEFVSRGSKIDADTYEIDMGVFVEVMGLSKEGASQYLYLAIEAIFRDKYNAAIVEVKNREAQLKEQGYLDF